jgi:hypothetical protein
MKYIYFEIKEKLLGMEKIAVTHSLASHFFSFFHSDARYPQVTLAAMTRLTDLILFILYPFLLNSVLNYH